MTVRVRITGLENATRRLRTQVGRAIKEANVDDDLKEITVEAIREKGVEPELAPSTIRYREFYEGNNATHPDYSAAKSNLTYTGQLLDKIRVAFQVSKLRFNFLADGTHRRLKGKKGRPIGTAISNKKLLGYVNEQRPILQVFRFDDVKEKLVQKIRNAIRRNFR